MSSEIKNRNGSPNVYCARLNLKELQSRYQVLVASLQTGRKVSATAPGGLVLVWRTADKVSHDGLSWLEAACGATSRLIACIFYVEACVFVCISPFFVAQPGQLNKVEGLTRVICFSNYTQWFAPAGREKQHYAI